MADLETELEALDERISDMMKRRHYKSVLPLIQEGIDRSREARNFNRYIGFLFDKVRRAHIVMRPEEERDVAIEMISLLESEEAARRVDPGLDPEDYEAAKYWMSSCAYDRLAHATMAMQGCNSEGMFGAIDAGVQVCHRTGKTRCVVCFRENGVDSSISADDLEIAMNQAMWLAHRNQEEVQHDRRVQGWRRVCHIKLLEGDPRTAIRAIEPAWEVAGEYHSPDSVRTEIHRSHEVASLLLGEPQLYQEWARAHELPPQPPRGESEDDDLDNDLVDAMRKAAEGDWDSVEELLTPWLQELDERKHLHRWFSVARQLFASRVTAGRKQPADELGDKMLKRAEPAREWFIQRLVRTYRHPDFTPNPYGTIFPMLEGPWQGEDADTRGERGEEQAPEAEQPEETTETQEPGRDEPTEMEAQLSAWAERLNAAEDPQPVMDEVEKEILGVDTDALKETADARAWLMAGIWLAREGRSSADVWRRAKSLQRRFADQPGVVTFAADVGYLLREFEGETDVRPEPEELDAMYRRAMSTDPDHAQAHYSAGQFYESIGNLSEAERCYARAFRLNRENAAPALAVARIYRATDRPRDALEALDLAIRYGCGDFRIFWEAMVDAFDLGHWERCLAYAQALAEGAPEATGVRYFMALASVQLEKWDEAIELIDKEAELSPEHTLQVPVIHASAHAGAGRREQAGAEVRKALEIPLPEVDYMSPRGLSMMFAYLYDATVAAELKELQEAVVLRARRAGVLFSDYFERYRLREDNEPRDVRLYEVEIRQPLPADHGDKPDTPAWERDWGSYLVRWLVLSEDEAQASELALEQQRLAADLPPEVLNAEPGEHLYVEPPGVVEEGVREGNPNREA